MHLDSPAVVVDVPDPGASRFTALAHPDHGMRITVRPLA